MEKIIIKYLNDSLSETEQNQLEEWLKVPGNQEIFESYVKYDHDVRRTLGADQSSTAYDKIKSDLKDDVPQVIRFPRWKIAAVASIVLLIGAGILYQTGWFNPKPLLIPGTEDITIEWADGRVEVLHPGESINFQDGAPANPGDEVIPYGDITRDTEATIPVFNTLRVPYGKKFEIDLSDGSRVNLQSGTSLRFPTRFSEEGKRQVFLEGEAYFQVAHHSDIPFVVTTDRLNVEVTGTAFNVSAYPEDVFIDVVLEEGGVGLYQEGGSMDQATLLSPGYIGSLDRRSNAISTQKINTSIYTNWLEGKLTFRNMSFDNILRKLERHYNIKMINQDKKLGQETFNASFDKDETIENVLGFFNESYQIEFIISDNTVIIQ